MSERAERAETAREEAEAQRRANELLRRHAEGGPDNKVEGMEGTGRQEAEEARAAAERDRAVEGKWWYRSIPMAFIVLIPMIAGFALLGAEFNARSNAQEKQIIQNKAVNKEQDKLRATLVRGFRRSDVLHCRAIEDLKAQNRAAARLSYSRLDETLELLGLERTPGVEAAAARNRDEALARNAPSECGELPPG